MFKNSFATILLILFATASLAQDADVPPSTRYDTAPESAHFAWADVLSVDPVYQTVSVSQPRQECHDERVVEHQRGNSGAGTILGAVVGGVLGSTLGHGDGRKAATVVGAVAGGAIGHNVAGANDGDYAYDQTRCRQVQEVSQEQQISSYDVEYRYRGEVYMSRLDYDPGERLRVRVSVTPAG